MNIKGKQEYSATASQSGFSLIELMVALAMSLFLMGGVILMYTSARAAFMDSEQLSRMQESVRFASDYLVRDIRNAGFRDEMSLTIAEEQLIRQRFAVLSDGNELIVRYAGRGHCEDEFDEYMPVQNRYFVDAQNRELRCEGRIIGEPEGSGIALVGGVTAISYEMLMADGVTTETDSVVCSDDPLAPVPLNQRCLGVNIGIEFEGMRDLDDPGALEARMVELFATFRNSAIELTFRNL